MKTSDTESAMVRGRTTLSEDVGERGESDGAAEPAVVEALADASVVVVEAL